MKKIVFHPIKRQGNSVCSVRRWRSLLFLRAALAKDHIGRGGETFETDQLYEAGGELAREVLSTLMDELGSFSYLEEIVQCTLYVASAGEYADMPKAANGFSDVLTGIFGDRGRHARAAMGCERLSGNAAMTVEAIVRVRRDA